MTLTSEQHHRHENALQNTHGEHADAVTTASQNSAGAPRRRKRNAARSINPSEATMMIAPRATVGSGASSGVRKSRKMMVSAAANESHPLRFSAHLIVDGRARGAERGGKPGQ